MQTITDYMPVLQNKRHERVARKLAKGKTQQESYMTVYEGCTAITAKSNGSIVANRPEVMERVNEILEQDKNLSLPNVLKHVGRSLKAKKEVIYNSKGDSKLVVDNTARSSAQEKLLKLYGARGFGKEQVTNNTLNIVALGDEGVSKLGDVLSQLKSVGVEQGAEQDGEVIDVAHSG